MLSGFKQFVLRGNVVDMAVGIVIGVAFATVVSAFTKDLLTPLERHRVRVGRLYQRADFISARCG